MAEDANKNTNSAEAETAAATGSDAGNNNTSNTSQGEKTEKNSPPATVPYERFKEVNDKLKALEGNGSQANNNSSSNTQDAPEDVVLDLVGKVPEALKNDMAAMAKYAREHKIPVDDVIALWSTKKGLTVPKDKVDEFYKANEAARQSGTGGDPNPAVRKDGSDLKTMSDKDLEAQVKDLASQGRL